MVVLMDFFRLLGSIIVRLFLASDKRCLFSETLSLFSSKLFYRGRLVLAHIRLSIFPLSAIPDNYNHNHNQIKSIIIKLIVLRDSDHLAKNFMQALIKCYEMDFGVRAISSFLLLVERFKPIELDLYYLLFPASKTLL